MNKKQKQEIAFSNRHLYYYASLLKRLYGFVIRREGKTPDERYVGQLGKQPERKELPTNTEIPSPLQAGRTGDPAPGEIILFRYCKRLLLGYCQDVLSRAVSEIFVHTEDGRRLRFHHTNLIYLSGITVENDGPLLQTYARAIHKISSKIDLHPIWDLTADASTTLSFNDIAELYWNGEIDPTHRLALYLHLHRACPYFEPVSKNTFVSLSKETSNDRLLALLGRKKQQDGRDEFIHWMNDETDADINTLTHKQHTWFTAICQYALWGQEAEGVRDARDLLNKICPHTKDLKHAAFNLLVAKGIWSENENLDLLRAEMPTTFDPDVEKEAQNLRPAIKDRKRLRQRLFVIRDPDLPELGLSYRKPLFGGPEFGVHIPDLSARILRHSFCDQSAATRLQTVALPDQHIPLWPESILEKSHLHPDNLRPTVSLVWKMDRRGRLKNFTITPTKSTVHAELSVTETDRARANPNHLYHRAITFFENLANSLHNNRSPRDPDFDIPDLQVRKQNDHIQIEPVPDMLAHHILRELSILAARATARWCIERDLPAIYETRDPVENLSALMQIEHPIVRRHEIRRITPPLRYHTQPAHHHGLGISACCPITDPQNFYIDLLMQRQIVHCIQHNKPCYTPDELDLLRYRIQETRGVAEGLTYRRQRDLLIQTWQDQPGREFTATVLHIKRHGVVVELSEAPFKTIVYPGNPVQLGDQLTLRLTGVNRWRSLAHFTVVQPESIPRP